MSCICRTECELQRLIGAVLIVGPFDLNVRLLDGRLEKNSPEERPVRTINGYRIERTVEENRIERTVRAKGQNEHTQGTTSETKERTAKDNGQTFSLR